MDGWYKISLKIVMLSSCFNWALLSQINSKKISKWVCDDSIIDDFPEFGCRLG